MLYEVITAILLGTAGVLGLLAVVLVVKPKLQIIAAVLAGIGLGGSTQVHRNNFV